MATDEPRGAVTISFSLRAGGREVVGIWVRRDEVKPACPAAGCCPAHTPRTANQPLVPTDRFWSLTLFRLSEIVFQYLHCTRRY